MTDRGRVSRLTFVPFLHDGRCALIPVGDRLALPSGEVLPGEDPLLDTGLRVPLVTAGFRRQSLHELEAEGDHLYLWCEGDDGYRGSRPHAEVSLWKGEAAEAARRLRAAGDERAAEVVKAVDRARRTLDDERWYRDGLRLMEASYLREPTPQGGSGFGGTAAQWRSSRCQICQAIDRDGTFLDAGCANGHLMESITAWCAERGVSRETIRLRPFGGPGGRGPTAPAPVGRPDLGRQRAGLGRARRAPAGQQLRPRRAAVPLSGGGARQPGISRGRGDHARGP